jgi:hypothetical protein
MMMVIEIVLLAVVAILFVLMAIAPMVAEPRPSGRVRRAEIVPITPPTHRESDMHRADAA